MTISFKTNGDSLTALRSLTQLGDQLANTREQLSSGLRINKAGDDSGSLVIASSLTKDASIFRGGITNVSDGAEIISHTYDGLSAINDIIDSISSLAEIATSSGTTSTQREAFDVEAEALRTQYNEILSSTQFSSQTLSGGLSATFQAGKGSSAVLNFSPVSGGNSTAGLSNLDPVNVQTQEDAAVTYDSLAAPNTTVEAYSAFVGTFVRRLDTAAVTLNTMREEHLAAAGNQLNIDQAETTAKALSLQIRQDRASAIFAQANQSPKIVLRLLDEAPLKATTD